MKSRNKSFHMSHGDLHIISERCTSKGPNESCPDRGMLFMSIPKYEWDASLLGVWRGGVFIYSDRERE